MALSFQQRYGVISFSFASRFLRTFIFSLHGLLWHDVFFSLWCFIKTICVFLRRGRFSKMWIQICLLFKPKISFYTHECINNNTNIGSVLYFWLAFIVFFLLVLTSKWPSIIVNNNIMPQTIFKNKFFVKLSLLQLYCVDLFWMDYFVFFVRHQMTIVQVLCIDNSLVSKFQSHFLCRVDFFSY